MRLGYKINPMWYLIIALLILLGIKANGQSLNSLQNGRHTTVTKTNKLKNVWKVDIDSPYTYIGAVDKDVSNFVLQGQFANNVGDSSVMQQGSYAYTVSPGGGSYRVSGIKFMTSPGNGSATGARYTTGTGLMPPVSADSVLIFVIKRTGAGFGWEISIRQRLESDGLTATNTSGIHRRTIVISNNYPNLSTSSFSYNCIVQLERVP